MNKNENDPRVSGEGEARIVARPRVSSSRYRPSLIWIVPVVAALVSLSLLVQSWMSAGPQITIKFQNATGIEAGKTAIKYKDVVIGTVTAIALSPDNTHIVVTADLKKSAEQFAREGSRFWVVRPRIGASGVSGIDTMLSGAYIGADIGQSEVSTKNFVGLETPPTVISGTPGKTFTLLAEDLGSVEIGSPVYFRRIQVGQVASYQLASDGSGVSIEVFIFAPNDRFVTTDSRFWNASGLDLSLGADGLKFNTQSLATVISGGIAFASPRGAETQAGEHAQFVLAKDKETAMADSDGVPMQVRMRFDQSLRGLNVGAPIDFVGTNIGSVTSIQLDYDAAKLSFPVVVDAVIYPKRLRNVHEKLLATYGNSPDGPVRFVQALIEKGLRAQPKPGNLLTGQLFIAFDFVPNAPRVSFDGGRRPIAIPTVRAEFSRMQEQVASIVGKLDRIPFDSIGQRLDKNLADLDKVLGQVNNELLPEAKGALKETQRGLGSVSETLAPDAALPQNLNQTLLELQRSARSLRTLTDLLGRHPESLLRGTARDLPLAGGGDARAAEREAP